MKIGILAIQGDYEAHAKVLDRLGVEHVFVRTPEDLAGLAGIILPGGESTTHLKVMTGRRPVRRAEAIRARTAARSSAPAPERFCWRAKCTARRKHSLGLLDISVLRNGYGRQLASDVHEGRTKLRKEPLEMVFIRAPIIESVGKGVEILAEDAGHPVLVQQGKIARVHVSPGADIRHSRSRAFRPAGANGAQNAHSSGSNPRRRTRNSSVPDRASPYASSI